MCRRGVSVSENIETIEKELSQNIIPVLSEHKQKTTDKILLDGIAIGMRLKEEEYQSNKKYPENNSGQERR